MANTLGKKERLKSRKAIDELFQSGKSFSIAPFRVVYNAAGQSLQFGVSVSSKNFKKAVDRNRIKRITREAYRLQKQKVNTVSEASNKGLHIFFIYTANEILSYHDVFASVEKVLNKLTKIVNEKNSSAA